MKVPEKLYVVKSGSKLSKPYKALHFVKMKMRSEKDTLITYTLESEDTLKSIKREKRLSQILDGKENKIDSNVISLFKKHSISLNKLPKILDKKDLKNLVVTNKRKLFINIDNIKDYETLLNFHNFQKCPIGMSDKKVTMFHIAKENIKNKNKD